MSGLSGKIRIGIDYRPCIVHIPAVTKPRRRHTRGTACDTYQEVIEPEKDIKALFHCWSYRSELVGESPLRGGHPGGQISATFGLVEYEDGTMHEIEPQNIRFVDGKINQYGFREENSGQD